MAMDLSGIISTSYDPTMLRDSIERTVVLEMTDELIGRNLVSRVFRFPNGAWSYTYMKRGYTRATVVTEFSHPPMVHPRVRKFGMEYHEIATAVGISDRMIRFQDFPTMEWNIESGGRAMGLKQDRDIINLHLASVPYYHDGDGTPVPFYLRLQNADAELGEWRTFRIEDNATNKCSKGHSHIIVGSQFEGEGNYPQPSGNDPDNFLMDTLSRALHLIEEHPGGMANLCLFNPQQKIDIRNWVDFTKAHTSNPPSIAPPQFNQIMNEGWVGNWLGVNFVASHAMTPGTMLLMDTRRASVLAEYGAPFIEDGIRNQWQGWEAQMWRQYYQPAVPEPDYIVVIVGLGGDLDYGDDTNPTYQIDHTVKADVDEQYTEMPLEGFEVAGVPG